MITLSPSLRAFSLSGMAALLALLFPPELRAAPPQGTWVNLAADGRLLYARDSLGNRVPDFGDCGYKAGRLPIPEATVKVTVNPAEGDDRAAIQAAINQVAALPMDANGIRGAVLLTAGEYQLSSTLNLNASGVVLRGTGASDAGTRLRATDPRQYTLVNISGTGSAATVANTTKTITDKYVPVGARSFTVNNTTNLAVGHSIVVHRPGNQAWIEALGMDDLDNPWASRPVSLERVITRIEGNRVFIDAPVTTAIETKYGGGTIYRYTWSGRIQNSGIEDIKGISSYDTAISNDENHGWVFIGMSRAENCWVRRVISQSFGYACVSITSSGRQISVLDSQCLDPVSQTTGGRRYAFNIDSSTLCLVSNCYTRNDRHQYVTGSDTPGPHAFVSSSSDNARDDVGPHHRWGSALLFDRITCNGDEINVRNRGNSGSGHGWAGGNCVVWNSKADTFIIQNPPTARNWLIGSIGTVSGNAGTFDSNGANVFPSTLWGNQRQDLQASPNLQIREYTAGDMDEFTADAGESTPVDSAWQAQVAGQGTTGAFDALQGSRWVPWTHAFTLGANETITSATLWVSVRGMAEEAQNGRISFDDLGNSALLSQYAASIPTSGSTVLRIDLAGQLSRLGDGKLNLAVQNNVAVDWSMLELRVAAPLSGTSIATLGPEADASVRGGASAAGNFGSDPVLAVREDASADNDRRGLLRWNLSGLSGKVFHAKIRLTPVSVAATDLESGAVVATGNTWTENGVTWNNQPAAGARFVSWWPQLNHPVEIVVTSEVIGALSRDGKLSLQLFSTRPSGQVDYASKEHADPAKRPQLIIVTDGSFSLQATPSSRSLSAGTATTYSVAMTTQETFTGPVSFSVQGLPANTSATFNPPALNAAGSTTLTVSSSTGTPGGSHDLTITGTGPDGTSEAAVSMIVTTPGTDLIWNSTSNTAWDLNSANWFNEVTGAADVFQANKGVIFTDRANVVTGIGIASGLALTPSAVKVNAGETDYSITGAGKISGNGGLTKTGAGLLMIATANDYTGVTTLGGGVLSVPSLANGGAASPIGAAAAAPSNLVFDGGALRWTGDAATTTNRGFTITPNGASLESSPVIPANLTASGAIAYSGSGNRVLVLGGKDPAPLKIGGNVLSPVIADGPGGSTALVKDGDNAWNLSGSSSYSGGSTVSAGRLRANSTANALGSGPVTVAEGAQAYLNVAGTFPNAFTLSGIGITEIGGNFGAIRLATNGCTVGNTVTLAGNSRITARGASGSGATISGKITGEYSLELGGSTTPNNAGIINRIPATTNAIVLRSAADADQSESQTLSTKRLNDANTRIAYLRFGVADIKTSYSVEELEAVTLRLHLNGAVAGETVRVYGLLDTNAAGISDSVWTGAATWNTQPAKSAAPNDLPSSASALPNANTTVVLGTASGFAAAGEVAIPLDLAGIRSLLGADSNQQITLLFHSTSTGIPGWASLGNTGGFLVPTLEVVAKPFGGPGGILTLSHGGNDWSGQTTISHGTVRLGSATALPKGPEAGEVVINNNHPNENSVLDLKGFNPSINGLSSSGLSPARCIVTNSAATAASLTVGTDDAESVFGGVIQNGTGAIALVKTGRGSQTLGGANIYSGSTVVEEGLLAVNGSLAGGAVTVQDGGTLAGGGIVNTNVTVNVGGTLAPGPISPGASIGILTVNQAITLNGTVLIELNKSAGTCDEIRGATSIHYGGALTVVNYSHNFAAGDRFKLFTAGSYSGAFTVVSGSPGGGGLFWDTSRLAIDGTLGVVENTPVRGWRLMHFGTIDNAGNAADTANPAGDGVANLMKYALGMNPAVPAGTGLPTASLAAGKLQIRFNRNPAATDVNYSVMATGDLAEWTSIAARAAGSPGWIENGSTVIDNAGEVTVIDHSAPGTNGFLRLAVTRPDQE